MKRFLLDTSFALFSLAEPTRIPARTRRTVQSGVVYLSVISYWEVLLKSMKGKLEVGDVRVWWPQALEALAATVLPLRPEHITAIHGLPPIHQDPFDRALIAQATVEELTLVTTDTDIPRYESKTFRTLSV
ncbi:MAG: type II toxin-antitoxin system VapC family toxin [Bryobacteraceae bacterium]